MKKLFLLAIVVLGFTAVSFAQPATPFELTGNSASATFEASIGMTSDASLNFGLISLPGATPVTDDASVTMNAAGVVANTTGISMPLSYGPVDSRGIFTITGTPEAFITITIPALITLSPGVTVTTANNGITQIEADGNVELQIYGVLNILGGTTSGTKTGTYDISVVYN